MVLAGICIQRQYRSYYSFRLLFLFSDLTRVQEQASEVDILNHQMEEMFDSIQKNYRCTDCGKSYKTDGWFKKHLVKEHNWDFSIEEAEDSKPDHIAVYRSSFMKCALILRDTSHVYKFSDGDRILRNAKFELICVEVGKHPKYKLWLFRFIAYCISVLSEKQSMEYLRNCMANTTGGIAKNVPNDNLVEILVHSIKKGFISRELMPHILVLEKQLLVYRFKMQFVIICLENVRKSLQ